MLDEIGWRSEVKYDGRYFCFLKPADLHYFLQMFYYYTCRRPFKAMWIHEAKLYVNFSIGIMATGGTCLLVQRSRKRWTPQRDLQISCFFGLLNFWNRIILSCVEAVPSWAQCAHCGYRKREILFVRISPRNAICHSN